MSKVLLLKRAKEVREVIRISPTNYTVGLCELLCGKYGSSDGEVRELLRDIMRCWPEFSGRMLYPVPAPKVHSGIVYVQGKDEGWAYNNLPRYTGKYGASRIRLLDYVIETLEGAL